MQSPIVKNMQSREATGTVTLFDKYAETQSRSDCFVKYAEAQSQSICYATQTRRSRQYTHKYRSIRDNTFTLQIGIGKKAQKKDNMAFLMAGFDFFLNMGMLNLKKKVTNYLSRNSQGTLLITLTIRSIRRSVGSFQQIFFSLR